MRNFAYVGLVALTASCASNSLETFSDFNPEIDIASYSTYYWVADDPLLRIESKIPISPMLPSRLKTATSRVMDSKGYAIAADRESADILVSFTLGTRDTLDIDTTYSTAHYRSYQAGVVNWGRDYYSFGYDKNVDVDLYTEGTLAVDFFLAETGQPAWHGYSQKEITEDDLRNPSLAINEAIEATLAAIPQSSS